MLIKNQLVNFFQSQSIPLNCEKSLSEKEVDLIFSKAICLEKSLGSFVLCTVINSDRNGISTSFEDDNDLYDCYCAFMVGFMSKIISLNN